MTEEIYLQNLATCGNDIARWKRRYFRRNSRKPARISVRCNHGAEQSIFWQYFIELWVGDKLIEQHRIRPEAFYAMTSDPSLEKTNNPGMLIVTLESFYPIIQTIKP